MKIPDTQPTNTLTMPSVGQFQSNLDFHKRSQQLDTDSAFLGYRPNPWIQKRITSKDSRREREMLMTLLSTQDEYASDYANKLIDQDISYNDLGSLTSKDLELIGVKSRKQCDELLKFFTELPNQDPSYESICKMPEAKTYNNQILGNAASHLATMRAALAASNYKLQVQPPEDVVVGDKRYASRFALEALASVQGLTEELVLNLQQLEKIAEERKNIAAGNNRDAEKKKSNTINLIWLSSIAFGLVVLSALWMWKLKKTA